MFLVLRCRLCLSCGSSFLKALDCSPTKIPKIWQYIMERYGKDPATGHRESTIIRVAPPRKSVILKFEQGMSVHKLPICYSIFVAMRILVNTQSSN